MQFSVIIPVYNKAEFIVDAIHSVQAQTVQDYEIIVVDDGSTDALSAVLAEFTDIQLIRQENSGVSVARNTGIQAASGTYICFLDADDQWFDNHLAVLRGLIEKYPKQAYFSTSHIVTTADGKCFDSGKQLTEFEQDFVCENLFRILNEYTDSVIHTNSICVKKTLLTENEIYFEPGEKIGEDTDMWLRLALVSPIVLSKMTTTQYHRENSTATKETHNSFTWKFAQRRVDILKMDIADDVKNECMKLLDRYMMACSRDCLMLGNRRAAKDVLKNVTYKSFKYYISVLFTNMPYVIFRFIRKHFI